MRNVLNRSDVRIAVLDLEASALGFGSYPVEVGVALIQPAGHPIRTWSTMIRPTKAWRNEGLWSPASAGVHGISLDTLQQEGHAVEEVCAWLNALLGSRTIVATDAPRYDQDWLDTLFKAAGLEQQFTLYNVEILTADFCSDQHRQLAYMLSRAPVPHRAGPDALRVASKLMEAHLGYPPRAEPLEHPPYAPEA
jgi:DNA polymerase III epsilon subunit-like protein